MRKAALTGMVFVACGFATNAQLSITPKVGIEQAFTSVQYNGMGSIYPMGSEVSPQVGLRMDYLFNKVHGPFLGVATNRSLVTYQFTNPEMGDKEYMASRGDWQLRYEAGYQVSSKPITLSKPAKQTSEKATPAVQSPCGARLLAAKTVAAKNAPMNLFIQPYAGMAFIPNTPTAVSSVYKNNETIYQYNAGNWSSAFIAGTQFAFAKGSDKKVVVGVQYLKGIGNLNTETISTALDNKQIITRLKSTASAWNLTVGMPLTFSKSKPVEKTKVEVPPPAPVKAPVKKSCSYYRSRCSHW
jgi:hypothetical protein